MKGRTCVWRLSSTISQSLIKRAFAMVVPLYRRPIRNGLNSGIDEQPTKYRCLSPLSHLCRRAAVFVPLAAAIILFGVSLNHRVTSSGSAMGNDFGGTDTGFEMLFSGSESIVAWFFNVPWLVAGYSCLTFLIRGPPKAVLAGSR